MLRGVTYRPPSSGGGAGGGPAAGAAGGGGGGSASYRPRQKSVNCLGGCSERKGSSVSISHTRNNKQHITIVGVVAHPSR